jgi:signal transduction histidine kinase/phage shock protein PspC (stress-responsive transcriptional regulator)
MPPWLRTGDHGGVTTADHAAPEATPATPRLYRRSQHRILGGVAGGIADHIGVSARSVRIVFVLLTLFGGVGVVLYGVFWIVLPPPPGHPERIRTTWLQWLLGAILAVVAIGVVAYTLPLGSLFVPSVLAIFGAALIWRQASETQRARWWRLSRSSLTAESGQRIGLLRILIGISLVVLAAGAVVVGTDLSAAREAFVAVIVAVIGLALITGPWWIRLASELSEERAERIRSQERAELAAHLHDSVLQTLALIQRNSDSSREVVRLARGQERELRTLLYGTRTSSGQLADAVRAAAGEVEDDYAIQVDVVVVGDAVVDDKLAAVVAASREALVNAAKHAGVSTVSLYVESDERGATAFVRDRGSGFDIDAVGEDRHGLRSSIIERIERHGGKVDVRSTPGTGTEIEISMPR